MVENPEPEPSEEDQRQGLYEQLGKVDKLVERHRSAKPGTPVSGSLEWRDRLHPLGAHVVIAPTMKLAVALDHLIVWAMFYRDIPSHPLPGYSQFTLLRPSFEASAQVRWVLDPNAATEERIGRAMAVETSSLRFRGQVEKNMLADGWPVSVSAQQRIDELREAAKNQGVTIVAVPDSTSLIRDMNPGKMQSAILTLWQVTSGVLHAQEWAALLGNHETTRAGESFDIVEHTASVGYTLSATVGAVHQLGLGLRALEAYLEPNATT